VARRGAFGEDRQMRRLIVALAVVAAAAVAAPAASAKSKCPAPSFPSWHSCLAAAHVPLANGHVKLTRATPALVIRLSTSCPAHVGKRRVVIRNKKGKRLASAKVKGRCRNGVERFRVNIRPELVLRSGAVIESFWSGIPDADEGPQVTLGD
jgi:hypothetical protein